MKDRYDVVVVRDMFFCVSWKGFNLRSIYLYLFNVVGSFGKFCDVIKGFWDCIIGVILLVFKVSIMKRNFESVVMWFSWFC